MKKTIITLLVILASAIGLSAAETYVTGKVLKAADNSPVEFVTVTLLKGDKQIDYEYTDWDGSFTFSLTDIESGSYILRATGDGFAPAEAGVEITGGTDPDPVTILVGNADPVYPTEYDYELEATVNADARWYGTRGTDDEHGDINRYYLVLSNKTLGDDNKTFQPDGIYYAFEFFGPAPKVTVTPESIRTIRPVDGTYQTHTRSENGETVWLKDNFSLWGAAYYSFDGQGRNDKELYLPEGRLTITTVDEYGTEYMLYDAVFIDQNGQAHHLTYKTRYLGYRDSSQSAGALNNDLDLVPSIMNANYESLSGKTMKVNFYFQWDGTWSDDETEPYKDMVIGYINAFMPYDKETGLQNGTYTVNAQSGEDFSIELGQLVSMGGVEYPLGSYAMYVDRRRGVHWAMFKEGTMTISGEGKTRNITAQFTTPEGYTIKLAWEGEIAVDAIPYSTLESDIELDLEGATAVATYLGDPYRTDGSTWQIRINPAAGKKDGFQTCITSESAGFANGITSGEYICAVDPSSLWPYQYQMGVMTDVLSGTWYLSDFDSDNIPHTFAPATGAENEYFTITNNNDGSYTLDFLFNDGLDHTWKGSWTGVPKMVDPEASVESIVADGATVTATAGSVIISGADGETYLISDMTGRIVARGTAAAQTTVDINAGLYIVSTGARNFKVIVP